MKQGIVVGILLATMAAFAPAAEATPGLSVVASFNAGAFEIPESVTIDDEGTFYMSMGPTVRRLPHGGALELVAPLPIPEGAFAGGVKVGLNGEVYVVSGGFSPSPSAAFVWRIDDCGTVHQVAALDPNGFPDDLAFDDEGNLYVSDAFLGQIWKIEPDGDTSVWLSSPLFLGNPTSPAVVISPFGAVGMAFDRRKENLYVANLDAGAILRVPVDDCGEPGTPEVFASGPLLVGADGIAFDKKGTLYVGVHVQDRVAAIEPDGTVSVLVEGAPLDAPASLVFGTRPGDRKTLYISNFAINRFLGTQPGTPSPSLMSLPLGEKGLLLP